MVRINLDTQFKGSPTAAQLKNILSTQKAAFDKAPNMPWAKRKANLQKLGDIIKSHEDEFVQAISKDFGHRAAEETILAETMVIQGGISPRNQAYAQMDAYTQGTDGLAIFAS